MNISPRLLLASLAAISGFMIIILVLAWSFAEIDHEQEKIIAAAEQVAMDQKLQLTMTQQFMELGYYLLTQEQEDIENFRKFNTLVDQQLRAWEEKEPVLRATSLEYLERILPVTIRQSLWPLLGGSQNTPTPKKSEWERLDSLLLSHESILLQLEELAGKEFGNRASGRRGFNEMDPPLCGSASMSQNEFKIREPI